MLNTLICFEFFEVAIYVKAFLICCMFARYAKCRSVVGFTVSKFFIFAEHAPSLRHMRAIKKYLHTVCLFFLSSFVDSLECLFEHSAQWTVDTGLYAISMESIEFENNIRNGRT